MDIDEEKRFTDDIVKAIKIAESSFENTKKRVKNVEILDTEHLVDGILPKIAYLQGNYDKWIKQLTAVIVWNAIGSFDKDIDWIKAYARSPNRIRSKTPGNLLLEQLLESENEYQQIIDLEKKLPWSAGWQAGPRQFPPSIYNFSLLFDFSEKCVTVKHRFYDSFTWYVQINASIQTMAAMKNKALMAGNK